MATTRGRLPAAIVDLGCGHIIEIHGHDDVYGIPTVELRGTENLPYCMLPEHADRLADGLKLAARMARGEAVPTALDALLAKGQTS